MRVVLGVFAILVAIPSSGCYTKRMQAMENQIDTLRTQVAELRAAQEVALTRLEENLEQQENLLHSLRAGTNVASQDMVNRIEVLSAKLDDTADRIERVTRQSGFGAAAVGLGAGMALGAGVDSSDTTAIAALPEVDAQTMYEQAAKDFTQGRFELALTEFRALLGMHPTHELADNALYGVGESFYALAEYDSAAVTYQLVEQQYPSGDKVPASLYKLGMTYQKMSQNDDAKETFIRLREQYPRSGEAILAEERLAELDRL